MNKQTASQLDALLPQTQCRECSYAGCQPYAEAIINDQEAINRCPPGGTETLQALAKLLNQDASLLLKEMKQNTRPPRLAKIHESDCIGCTKCIQACPVDAIIGSGKQMHTIINQECTGCGLCIEPCPVDCIELITLTQANYKKNKARQRYHDRQSRLQKEQQEKQRKYQQILMPSDNKQQEIAIKQAYIKAAVIRAKAKKQHFLQEAQF